MSETIKCYKVVKQDTLQSVISSCLGPLTVTYKVGKFVKAPENCLFVFDSLIDARYFRNGMIYGDKRFDIYEAEGRLPVKQSQILFVGPSSAIKFYNLRRMKKKCFHMITRCYIPTGTLGFKEVKLIRKVT